MYDDYQRYTELILQRDALEKEAFSYETEYIRVFGELKIKAFELKIDCIRLKKEIAYCIVLLNTGKKLNTEEMDSVIAKQLSAYTIQLKQMRQKQIDSKPVGYISLFEEGELKKIYRKIAKLIHPDINPLTLDHENLIALFARATNEYHCNNLKGLKETEVLVIKALSELGVDINEPEIPDIKSRIHELETEINTIITTEPYTYSDVLQDAFATQKLNDELNGEIKEYTEYKTELETKLAAIKEELK